MQFYVRGCWWKNGVMARRQYFVSLLIWRKHNERIPREEMWECLRLAETSECYVRVIKDMYDGATTTVRCAARPTEEFEVGVGLHHGSTISPFLFAIIMNKLTEDIRKEVPWDMMFADAIVLL